MTECGRAESVIQLTGYGGASACLMLRIPLTRRDLPGSHQIACPLARKNRPV